jgi:hypothetical protein
MSDAPDQALSQAFQLVEDGKNEEAIAILQPLLDRDPDNADAWWILSYAVSDPQKARNALNQVLRIDRNYPGARDMLAQLDEKFPVFGETTPRITRLEKQDVPPPPEPPEPIIERARPAGATTETPAVRPTAAAPAPSRRSPLPLVLLAVAAIVIIVALLLLLNQPGTPPATPTAVASAPTTVAGAGATEEAGETTPSNVDAGSPTSAADETPKPEDTETGAEATQPVGVAPETTEAAVETTTEPNVQPEVTEAVAEGEATEAAPEATGEEAGTGAYPELEAALASFTPAPDGIVQAETSFGNGLLASVCAAPGREMRALAPAVMTAMARQAPTLPAEVEAVGVRLINCETNTPMLTLAVDRETANAFAERTLGAAQFQAAWQPQQ